MGRPPSVKKYKGYAATDLHPKCARTSVNLHCVWRSTHTPLELAASDPLVYWGGGNPSPCPTPSLPHLSLL